MKEQDLYSKIRIGLNNPGAIAALGLGSNPFRFVKPRDGWGYNAKAKAMVRMPNPVDMYWTNDCLEVKIKKARTEKGMNFKVKDIDGQQLKEMQEFNALLAIGFVLDGKDKQDRLVCIPVLRWYMVERMGKEIITRWQLVEASPYIIKGEAYNAVKQI